MALPACDINVQSDGSDNNGGGFVVGGSGTDYSQQASPQLAITDGTPGASNTLQSTTGGFTAAMVDNIMQVVSGTDATPGFYRIVSVEDTNNLTLDRDMGTGGSDIVANVGGALATPGGMAAWLHANSVAGHRVHIKAGTYNNSQTTVNVSGGPVSFATGVNNQYNKVLLCEGYSSTWGDNSGTILIDVNGNAPASGAMWIMGGNSSGSHTVVNIDLDAGHSAGGGLSTIDGFTGPADPYNVTIGCVVNDADLCYFGIRSHGCIATNSNSGFYYGLQTQCVAEDCTNGFYMASWCIECIATGCTDGYYSQRIHALRCVAYDCSSEGFVSYIPYRTSCLFDCIAYSCGYSYSGMENSTLINCASGDPDSGRYDAGGDPALDINPITLSNTEDDVFVDAAGGDFRLVNTATDLWGEAMGVPGQTDNNRDIGAVQHADPASSGGAPHIIGG